MASRRPRPLSGSVRWATRPATGGGWRPGSRPSSRVWRSMHVGAAEAEGQHHVARVVQHVGRGHRVERRAADVVDDRVRLVRQGQADGRPRPRHEARAVERTPRRLAEVVVGHADLRQAAEQHPHAHAVGAQPDRHQLVGREAAHRGHGLGHGEQLRTVDVGVAGDERAQGERGTVDDRVADRAGREPQRRGRERSGRRRGERRARRPCASMRCVASAASMAPSRPPVEADVSALAKPTPTAPKSVADSVVARTARSRTRRDAVMCRGASRPPTRSAATERPMGGSVGTARRRWSTLRDGCESQGSGPMSS